MSNVTVIEPSGREVAASSVLTPMAMIDRALATGASIETLERLMALQERYEATQARKSFDSAISKAKAEITPVVKNQKGHSGRYADFAAIASSVDPIISKFGISYRFRTAQVGDRISVTCVLSHEGGHAEETTLSGPPDNSGSKNAIQAIGSTLSYLQRYSLVQALGLAAADDDDGKAAVSGRPLNADELAQLQALIDETDSDIALFCKSFKVAFLAEMTVDQLPTAISKLNTKKARKAQEASNV